MQSNPQIKVWVGEGRVIDPFSFTLNDITPQQIGFALSRINRFGGHGAFPYSVAQHSTTLSYMVPSALSKAALLHDVPEIFIGDVPKPIKDICPEIVKIEEKLIHHVAKVFDVPYAAFLEVKTFDTRIARDEAVALFPKATIPLEQRLGIEVSYQPPDDAAMDWTYRFYDLFMGEDDV